MLLLEEEDEEKISAVMTCRLTLPSDHTVTIPGSVPRGVSAISGVSSSLLTSLEELSLSGPRRASHYRYDDVIFSIRVS